jgi:hypothetical protein
MLATDRDQYDVLTTTITQKSVSSEARVLGTPTLPLTSNLPVITRKISFFYQIWPVGGLAVAAVVNVVWMSLLGYWIFKLVQGTFF